MKLNLYEQITNELIERMSTMGKNWIPSYPVGGAHRNVISNKPYRGVNMFRLWCYGAQYSSQLWGTYKQWNQLGYSVRKGEHGIFIIYYKSLVDKEDESKTYPLLRYSTVFNADQVWHMQTELPYPGPEVRTFAHSESGEREQFIQLLLRLKKEHGLRWQEIAEGPPHYSRQGDIVRLVKLSGYPAQELWIHDGLHELAHWTMRSNRLDRKLDYATEELVAELAAHFLSHRLGITQTTVSDTAQYLNGWIERAKEDSSYLIKQMSAASKAAEFILPYPEVAEEAEAA